MSESIHNSVLKNEAIKALNVKENGIYVDGTLGRAGHAREIAKQLHSDGLLIGFDQDKAAIEAAKSVLPDKSLLIHDNFIHLNKVMEEHQISEVDGILLDLGVSSPQLDEDTRGFSYHHDAVLDMRMDQRQSLSAYEVVNNWTYEQLAKTFFNYGEEKFSKNIARAIERERAKKSIETTYELVEIIKEAIPAPARRKGGQPAKRIFQAIRIAVNDELESFKNVLNQSAAATAIGGRVVVITFHSLEDRICKQAFKKWSSPKPVPKGMPIIPEGFEAPFKLITKKPILPSNNEVASNRRARSAKLRVIEKVKVWNESFKYEGGR